MLDNQKGSEEMEEIKYKSCAWSYEKAYLDRIMDRIIEKGIPCVCDSNLGRYLLSVPKDYYQNALDIIIEIGDENRMGSINHYDKFRPLKSYSLAYAYVEDAESLNNSWEDKFLRPKNIKKLLKKLKNICGCDVELIFNFDDSAVEILATKKLNNTARIRDKVYDFLLTNNYIKFKEVYICTPEGKIINQTPEEKKKIDNIYRLFDTSLLACGMYRPRKANLVSKDDEENYYSCKEHSGFTDDIKIIEEYNKDKIVITGETKLFESKHYNFAGEAISNFQNDLLSFSTKLVDKLDYNLTIIISDNMVAKITTKYKDSREVSSTRKFPFGGKKLDDKSVRDVFLPFTKESGEYEGVIQEYYMRSRDYTKLLHYATHSPYFEIYDIPADFDFIDNNEALDQSPEVYDIRSYNLEDPKIAPVKDIIDEAVKKIRLS